MAILTYNIFFEHSTVSKEGEVAVKKFCEAASFFAAVYVAGTAGFVWTEELFDEIQWINDSTSESQGSHLIRSMVENFLTRSYFMIGTTPFSLKVLGGIGRWK